MNDWRTYLHALPEADPPEALWQRLAQARAAASAPRPAAGRGWMAAGLAAAVALAAVLALPRQAPAPAAPDVVDAGSTLPAAPAVDGTALRALDDAIALAYARDAGQEELDSLWQTRERLLGSPAESEPLLARL